MARPKKVKTEAEDTSGLSALQRFRAAAINKLGSDAVAASDFDCDLTFLKVPDLAYQWALGRPGYAMGRIQTLMGFEGSSKTSKQLWLANLVLEQGGLAAAVFVEHADSTFHMKNYIPKQEHLDNFMCFPCKTLEQAIKRSYEIDNIFREVDPDNKLLKMQFFDSIAGATQEKLLEEDREMGAPKPGGIGTIMADFVNAMKTRISISNTLWCVNNQAREGIDIGFSGPPKAELEKLVAKGGRALPFAATYQEVVKKGGSHKAESVLSKKGKIVEGFAVKLSFRKNKLGVPYREVNYDVIWGEGLAFHEYTMEWLEMAEFMGIEKRNGGAHGTKYFSKEMGISSDDALPCKQMYDLVHSDEWMPKFQKVLGIITEIDVRSEVRLRQQKTDETPVLCLTPPPPPPPLLAPNLIAKEEIPLVKTDETV
jgi:recombination protein RecA